MKRSKNGSTIKQVAYARKIFNGDGVSKKQIAMSVGYSKAIANNANAKIERSEGFLNAMENLAIESNNLLLAILMQYKKRGLDDFSNKDLNGAANAISSAWDRISKQRMPDSNRDPEKNPLKKIYMTKVENQTINNITPIQTPAVIETAPEEEIDMDF